MQALKGRRKDLRARDGPVCVAPQKSASCSRGAGKRATPRLEAHDGSGCLGLRLRIQNFERTLERAMIEPCTHVDACGDELPAQQEIAEVLQSQHRLLGEIGTQAQMRIL